MKYLSRAASALSRALNKGQSQSPTYHRYTAGLFHVWLKAAQAER